MKSYNNTIAECTSDLYATLSRRYLELPCSCMAPNSRRLLELDKLIARFAPDVVVDVVLHACHSYDLEFRKIKEHIQNKHNMPFLKTETDYSQSDAGQIRTRVEALFETLPKK
jgi:benzoyl-CoA reductase/2-hydroxyglutaryl-CoA dehydratase subunit BcrC/BadD/HgdB